MTLQQLKYVTTVAQTGTISDAAKKLFISQPSLTKSIKEGANVPVYVLEFLLGQYCSSDDPEIIDEGVKTVKDGYNILLLFL